MNNKVSYASKKNLKPFKEQEISSMNLNCIVNFATLDYQKNEHKKLLTDFNLIVDKTLKSSNISSNEIDVNYSINIVKLKI